jgi:hypothetical protein
VDLMSNNGSGSTPLGRKVPFRISPILVTLVGIPFEPSDLFYRGQRHVPRGI